jgi:hypothetical protein
MMNKMIDSSNTIRCVLVQKHIARHLLGCWSIREWIRVPPPPLPQLINHPTKCVLWGKSGSFYSVPFPSPILCECGGGQELAQREERPREEMLREY